MSDINDFVCLHHPDSERKFITACPVCLQNEITKLKEAFRQSEDARKAWLTEFDRYKMKLADARVLIEKIGTVAVGNSDVIRAAQYWMEGKP